MDPALILLKIFCFFSSIFSSFREYCDYKEAINLSNYTYPTPTDDSDGIYRVAILGTNDIHGAAFPFTFKNPIDNSTFEYGGLQYLASYIKIMRNEWNDRFLWLDGGDQFQGKIESRLSNGSIITEFFNNFMLNGSTIGNHEWDFGQPFLYDRLESANWPYLVANIVNNTNQTGFLPNTDTKKIYQMGKVKVGVIGLSTIQTPYTTIGNLTNINFVAYKDIVVSLSKSLREEGANAVVLVSHIGMNCLNDMEEKMILRVRNPRTVQASCKNDEMNLLLSSLDPGVVDAVVAGHVHNVAHHWINGVPVVQSIDGGYYSHLIYLAFNSTTNEIIKDEVLVEGPLPTCNKVFDKTLNCYYLTSATAPLAGKQKKFIFHNKVMKADKSMSVLFDYWWQQVQVYRVFLTTTDFLCKRGRLSENPFGNLIADIYKNVSHADVSIINDGSLRSQWAEGDILVESVFNMFPFDNPIVSIEMTGAELKKALGIVQAGVKSFYHTSGLSQIVSKSPVNSLISVRMYDGTEIDDDATYRVATDDFLADGGDDFRLVREWYKPRNYINHGLVRAHVISSLKDYPGIKLSNLIDPNRKRLNVVDSYLLE